MTSRYFLVVLCFSCLVKVGQLKRTKIIIVPLLESDSESSDEPITALRKQSDDYERSVKIRRPKLLMNNEPKHVNKQAYFEDDEDTEAREEDIAFDAEELYNKIVGGFEVDINLYPYHAAYGSNCGAAIIDKNWAITAGHCGKKPFIRVGSKYLGSGRKVLVMANYIHPGWSEGGKDHPFDYDFQLLQLNEPLGFNNNIQPIKIAHIEDMKIGTIVTVTGWGNTVEAGPYSTVLRAVRVPVITKDACQSVQFPYFRGTLTPRMFCAGYSEGKKDACQGDSGGPAVANDRLLGIISFGYGCATPGAYGVYSKVAKVRSWIEETTHLVLD